MGSFSIWHWLVVLAVILVLFGGGNKISGIMGDFAKGIKSFKKNMANRMMLPWKNPPRSRPVLCPPRPRRPLPTVNRPRPIPNRAFPVSLGRLRPCVR